MAGLGVLAAGLAAATALAAGAGPRWLAIGLLPLFFFGFLALGQARAKT